MKISKQFIRFCAVGIINSSVDAGIFVALRQAGLAILGANIISTTIGLLVSLTLNYKFTFNSTQRLSPMKIVLYIVVTLVGLWALQPIVINGLVHLNTVVPYVDWTANIIGYRSILIDLLPKLGSIVVTLTWNYIWYSQLIFKNKQTAIDASISQQ